MTSATRLSASAGPAERQSKHPIKNRTDRIPDLPVQSAYICRSGRFRQVVRFRHLRKYFSCSFEPRRGRTTQTRWVRCIVGGWPIRAAERRDQDEALLDLDR